MRMQMMNREGAENDIVEAMLYLASPRAGFVTGQTLLVSGGAASQV
jgi:3-oxoacyl-[acyl-carrier protein] reductase